MSLLAEVVVEEWLNRQGYFTIRNIRIGNDEIDLLAVRPLPNGSVEQRHIEVQASVQPISYISRKNAKKVGAEELTASVKEWVHKKFDKENKQQQRASLGTGNWSRELVINQVKSEDEVALICQQGINVLRLADIVKELRDMDTVVKKAAGADLLELVHLASHDNQNAVEETLLVAEATLSL